jgi:hypothetical protein
MIRPPRSADDVASDLATALGGQVLGTNVAIARHDGRPVRCHVIGGVTHTEAGLRQHACEIEIAISRRPLDLRITNRNPPRPKVERGDAIDIEIGNAAFDTEFHVEGAPTDVIRVLFDEVTCRWLLDLPGPELSTVRVDGESVARLRIVTWTDRVILDAIHQLGRLVSRIDEAYEVADAVHTHHGSPYRNEVTPRARIDAARASDFDALARVRRRARGILGALRRMFGR